MHRDSTSSFSVTGLLGSMRPLSIHCCIVSTFSSDMSTLCLYQPPLLLEPLLSVVFVMLSVAVNSRIPTMHLALLQFLPPLRIPQMPRHAAMLALPLMSATRGLAFAGGRASADALFLVVGRGHVGEGAEDRGGTALFLLEERQQEGSDGR
jgi:hypothetical protein